MRMNTRQKTFTVLFFFLLLAGSLLIPRTAMVLATGKAEENETPQPVQIIDSVTGKPIAGALLTSGNEAVRTDENGLGYIKIEGNKLGARASGYLRAEERIAVPKEEKPVPFTPEAIYASLKEKVMRVTENRSDVPREVKLVPFSPKALYLSFYGAGDRTIRESALRLIRETELNALVIDVKGDRGMIPYPSSVPLAAEVGGQKIITIKDISGLVASLKEKGIYTIARIVVFKDNLLAQKMPELAVKTPKGELWRDREGLAWVDPSRSQVWSYNIDIALEAARVGFDEIQFDYVRFPDSSSPQFAVANTRDNRIQAISGFLMEARKRLLPYNVFLSADIFGYVCWNTNDTDIGQTLDDVAPHVDYLCPMLYPSGFQYGIPGFRIPVANPYEIVHLTLKRAQERTGLHTVRFRPWLQAFKDYAFDRRVFEEKQIRAQIKAAESFGAGGWMLWNPRNAYTSDGLKRRESSTSVRVRPEG